MLFRSPPKSLVKVNYDGATFQDLQKAGIGVAICNHVGLVLASMTDMITLPPSVDTVECLAAVRARHFASDYGFSSVILEGDSKIVYKVLSCEDVSLSLFGHLLDEIKSLVETFKIVNFTDNTLKCMKTHLVYKTLVNVWTLKYKFSNTSLYSKNINAEYEI